MMNENQTRLYKLIAIEVRILVQFRQTHLVQKVSIFYPYRPLRPKRKKKKITRYSNNILLLKQRRSNL